MRSTFLRVLVITISLWGSLTTVRAQDTYALSACGSDAKSKAVGDRLRLLIPHGATLKKGRDVDYSDYAVGFGSKDHRAWLEGIWGANATSGKVPDKWLSDSSEVTKRTWTFGNQSGIDWRGRLSNGNYWRYLGQFGESAKYYNVPLDAANYFDGILNTVCYRDWR